MEGDGSADGRRAGVTRPTDVTLYLPRLGLGRCLPVSIFSNLTRVWSTVAQKGRSSTESVSTPSGERILKNSK